MTPTMWSAVLMVLAGCGPQNRDTDDLAHTDHIGDTDADAGEAPEARVGFEVLHVQAPDRIVTWLAQEPMTQREFEELELPAGWLKNEPREGVADGSRFARSPDASAEGEFADQEQFGIAWRHVATVVATRVTLADDDTGLLTGNSVAKYHSLRFDEGRSVPTLISPSGEAFVLVSRDANRTQEQPTIPASWRLIELELQDTVWTDLPNPTMNLRTDNEDSFQGPVSIEDFGGLQE